MSAPQVKLDARSVVGALNHDDTYLIALALDLFSNTIMTLDRAYPDPEHRSDAHRAAWLATEFTRVNATRAYIEEGV